MSDLFALDFKTASYWWDRPPLSDETASALPTDCDVGIIVRGYTGLHAAIQTASVGGEAFDRNAGLDPVDIGVMNGELVERDGLRRGERDFG